MPPWQTVTSTDRRCDICEAVFEAKRDSAIYCSEACRNRGREPRQYDPVRSLVWRQRRLTDPEYRRRLNHQSNERAATIRRWLDAYKLSRGCVDCGYNAHHAALHFDHVRGEKALNVCNAKSIAQAQQEIEKCEVRCANCHAVKTFTLYPCKPDVFAATYEAIVDPRLPVLTGRVDLDS